MKQSPIFTRTYDLLRWLIPVTIKFPREQRFVLAEAAQTTAFAWQKQLIEAAYSPTPHARLREADATLTLLRTYLRLCSDMGLLTSGQYAHVSRMVDELGRLLGGWLESTKEKAQP